MKYIYFLLLTLIIVGCDDSDNEDPLSPDPSLVYFLVGEVTAAHGESFILPLKDAHAISRARQLIENKQTQIVVAEITRDKRDNYSLNKDMMNDQTWSWHVSTFLDFADNTIEILDGWPGYVEENYEEWVNQTKGVNGKGRIGFWNYTVIREVSKEELYR